MLFRKHANYPDQQLVHVDRDDPRRAELRSDDRPHTSARPDIQNAAARSYAQLESVVEFPVALRVTKEGLVRFKEPVRVVEEPGLEIFVTQIVRIPLCDCGIIARDN